MDGMLRMELTASVLASMLDVRLVSKAKSVGSGMEIGFDIIPCLTQVGWDVHVLIQLARKTSPVELPLAVTVCP